MSDWRSRAKPVDVASSWKSRAKPVEEETISGRELSPAEQRVKKVSPEFLKSPANARLMMEEEKDKLAKENPGSAFLAGVGDTLTLGALPQIAALASPDPYAVGVEEARADLKRLGDKNTGAMIAGNVVGVLPSATLSMPGRLATSAVQGALSRERLSQGDLSKKALSDMLSDAEDGLLLGVVGEGLGAGVGAATKGVARGLRSAASGKGVLQSAADALTGGNAKKELENKMLQTLLKQEDRTVAAAKRGYARTAKDIERTLRKDIMEEPYRAARLSPEEKAAQNIADSEGALERLKRQQQGALGQYTLNDLGYIRDALALSGGDTAAARQKLLAVVPEESKERVLQNFDNLLSKNDEKLVERLGLSAEERAKQEFEPLLQAAVKRVEAAKARSQNVSQLMQRNPAEVERMVQEKLAEALKAVPKPAGPRDYETILKEALKASQDRAQAFKLDPRLAAEVLDTKDPKLAELLRRILGRPVTAPITRELKEE